MTLLAASCYRCGKPPAEHENNASCPSPDPFWNCPEHAAEILWAGSDEWQDHFVCPADGCTFGRWAG